jgi:hypothetical protein
VRCVFAAELRGDEAAQAIQLHMVYAPEPPFDSGTPETVPGAILEQARRSVRTITVQREQTARRVAANGIIVPAADEEWPRWRDPHLARTEGLLAGPSKAADLDGSYTQPLIESDSHDRLPGSHN